VFAPARLYSFATRFIIDVEYKNRKQVKKSVTVLLELQKLMVRQMKLGEQTMLADGKLQVCAEDLCSELMTSDPRIQNLQIEVANPNEATRIVCVKDVIEPRLQLPEEQPGEKSIIRVLENAAVVTSGPIVGFQEGIIDMRGPGAEFTPFSSKCLIVLKIEVDEGLTQHEHEETVRLAGLRAAEHLARTVVTTLPDKTETVNWEPLPDNDGLPKIVYVYMLLSQGLLHDTYVLGQNANQDLPLIVDPRIGMTGGIVSGNCVSACDKNTTFFHQNNPVIAELMRGHGRKWNFVGVVITNEPTRLSQKQRSAHATIELVQQLSADGAIVSKEGFGNPDTDLMMIVTGLEQAGIRTTIITDEFAGVDGSSQSLADTTPAADAVVSTGNANQRIVLPPMDKVIGELPDVSRLAGGYPHSVHENGMIEVELQAIIGATNQMGFGRLSCREI
jgi:glycine reductase